MTSEIAVAKRAHGRPERVPPARGAIGSVAASYPDVHFAQSREHFRRQRLVVLKVGINHRGVGGGGSEHALDDGTVEAAPSFAANT